MNRTGLINYLIQQRDAKRYLEISAHDKQENFVHIYCKHKQTTFLHASSDSFFELNNGEFDIIFIDGIHTEEQVSKDIGYAGRGKNFYGKPNKEIIFLKG